MRIDDLELELRKLPGVRAAGFNERDDVLLVQLHVDETHHARTLPMQATRIAYRHSERPVAVELVRWRSLTERPGPAAAAGGALAPAPASPADEPAIPEPAPAGTAPEVAAPEPSTPLDDDWTRSAADDAPPAHDEGAADDAPSADDDAPARTARPRLLAVLTFPDSDELEVHLTLAGERTIGRAAASHGLAGAVDATVDALRSFAPSLAYRPVWARSLEAPAGEPYLVACELTDDRGSNRHGVAGGTSGIEAAARATLHALNRTLTRPVAV